MKIWRGRAGILSSSLCLLLCCSLAAALARRGDVTAQQATFRISQLALPTNDLVYHAPSNTILASVPSAAGERGNSITAIDPTTGQLISSTFVGSEPNRLALSDDGHYLYVALDGAATVRRYEIATQTPGLSFALGSHPLDGPFYADDLAVVPGHPESLVVARRLPGQSNAPLTIFDNEVPRANQINTFNGGFGIEFLGNAATLFAYENGPFSGLRLYRLRLDADGLSVAQAVVTPLRQIGRIKFAQGLLYAPSGQIINPETLTVSADFGDQGAGALVAPDATVGRVFFLTGTGATRTLRAFDQTTRMPLGALDVPGVVGTSTSLLRWGANGLGFRTTSGQLFLVQSLFVPSSEPILPPLPAPTPTPTTPPVPTRVQVVNLATKDILSDLAREVIYASVPSNGGAFGNSVVAIAPLSGEVTSRGFVGSEPGRLALAPSGEYLYVGLDGAGSVYRADLRRTSAPFAGTQFYLGHQNNYGPLLANDIEVAPDNNETCAVARYYALNISSRKAGVVLYDNGAPRARTGDFGGSSGGDSLAFAADGTALYAGDSADYSLLKYTVSSAGLSLVYDTHRLVGGEIKLSQGLLYGENGQVVEPETQRLQGRFNASGLVLPDAAHGRVYFLTSVGATRVLRAFDSNTFLPLGAVTINNVTGVPSSLVRWGANGLAFRTGGNQVYLIQTALVAPDPIIAPSPPPAPPPAPTPTPFTTAIRHLQLAANDIIYDRAGQTIYASVGSSGGNFANSITPINPLTGAVGAPVPIGVNPDKLAISNDGQHLYVALQPPQPAIRRFDTATQTAGLQFALGGNAVVDLKVLPDNANAVAVAQSDGRVAIYDHGTPRGAPTSTGYRISTLEFGALPSALYGYHSASSFFGFYRFVVNEAGVAIVPGREAISNLLTGHDTDLEFAAGRLYSSTGRVIDPERGELVGTFPISARAVAVDAAANRAFFISATFNTDAENPVMIHAFDLRTFLHVGSIFVPGVRGVPANLIRWGDNGFAFRTTGNQVVLVNTALLPGGNPPAPVVSVSAASYQTGQLARDSIAAVFGANLTDATAAAETVPLPTTLAGTRLNFDIASGQVFPAALFFVSPQQINFHIPANLFTGPRNLIVNGANNLSYSTVVSIVDVAPGLFSANADGQGVAAALVLRIKADGAQSYEPVAVFDSSQQRFVAQPIAVGAATEQLFLLLFGTGIRHRTALANVTATIGEQTAEVLFAGAQGGFVGLDQVNLRLPGELAGRGEVMVRLMVEGKNANAVTINIK